MIDVAGDIEGAVGGPLGGYRFIDLFAGIGGFHYALKPFGAECVFASEIDKKASDIYCLNHKLRPKGDITKIGAADIPAHDILCAGFPCQPFSVSGHQKGFGDIRGTLFFDIARIAGHHKTKIVFLENVKNLVRHDGGRTMQTIIKTLENLNYTVFYKVLNTSNFGLPQNRERIFIVGFNKTHFKGIRFLFPAPRLVSSLETILETNPENPRILKRDDVSLNYGFLKTIKKTFGGLPNRPVQIGTINKGRQGDRIYHPKGHAITLLACGAKGMYKIGNTIRKLTPRECARAQGFPEKTIIHKSVATAWKHFGNSVSIDTVQFVIRQIIKVVKANQ